MLATMYVEQAAQKSEGMSLYNADKLSKKWRGAIQALPCACGNALCRRFQLLGKSITFVGKEVCNGSTNKLYVFG